jgi:DNA-binding NtrC family response regulator
MTFTVYVVGPSPEGRAWIESALAGSEAAFVFLEDGAELLGGIAAGPDDCLIASADSVAEAAATLRLVRELRSAGATVPVIVLGPHAAFRTAVDIARLARTDFLERPVSERQLRAALRRAVTDVK